MTVRRARNPFRFESPLEPEDLIGRGREVGWLVDAALERRVVSLAAPRRYGKTSVLRAAGRRLESEHDVVVAHVDLLGLADAEDFAARFGSAWRRAVAGRRRLRRQLDQLLGGLAEVGVTVLGSGVQVTRRPAREEAGVAAVHALLDLPGDADTPVLVVLDEFQALHAAWAQGEGVLRSHTQSPQQAGRVAWAFAGSQPSLLAAAFSDAGRAYYQQALALPLGRLADADLAGGIAEQFRATGREVGTALSPLLRLAAGHPQRAMLLAHALWDATPSGGEADNERWLAALAQVRARVADEAAGVWESLSPAQQAALRSVQRHGTATAAPTSPAGVSRASRQSAQDALLRRGLVEQVEVGAGVTGRRYRPVDPLLGDWLDQRKLGG